MADASACDTCLYELVLREQERVWTQQHAGFIAAYNQTVETEGLPLEQGHSF
ncbi:MAG: type II toxin-antitoxin system CcdA family antitoxin [Glaciimonas sp.]|nr:type II toxin-antitoxin system CcdA family antitoxin [Glaciimonas sp.]